MRSMSVDDEYDWVDDESIGPEETLRRFNELEFAQVVTSKEEYGFVTRRQTWAGTAETVVKRYFAPQKALTFS
jgi:hypothetical protein